MVSIINEERNIREPKPVQETWQIEMFVIHEDAESNTKLSEAGVTVSSAVGTG